ncbi:unnamed protein product [Citrullus colocynthis]|uniref:Uncharacterized protein n=1 Tax=Citrullus colocynthis TaxID=252529 RepID=A0ABP0Y5D2_9ROSI
MMTQSVRAFDSGYILCSASVSYISFPASFSHNFQAYSCNLQSFQGFRLRFYRTTLGEPGFGLFSASAAVFQKHFLHFLFWARFLLRENSIFTRPGFHFKEMGSVSDCLTTVIDVFLVSIFSDLGGFM